MKRAVLVRGARQLLTLHGPAAPRRGELLRQLSIIEDGSVLIVNGVISNVGPTRRIENLAEARSAEEIGASGRVVMPGFIDSHTHVISSPLRFSRQGAVRQGQQEHPLGHDSVAAGIQYIRNTPATALEFQARRHILGFLRHGSTTIEAKSGFGLNEAGELKMLRVIASLGSLIGTVPTFLGANTEPPEYRGRLDEYNKWLCSYLLPKVRTRRLARFADVFCDPAGYPLEQARTYLDSARRLGLVPKIHAEQSVRLGAVPMAVGMEAVSVDGLNHASEEDIHLLGRSSTIATLLPGSVYQGSYSRFPPARALIDAGAAVALATAFHPGVSSSLSMQMAICLACTQMRMTPEEAISAATINAAHAVQLASVAGSLEFGKHADLIILNVPDYREIAYYFGVNQVALTMRKGEVVYREGTVT
jgi:imidazolonepropionase